MSLETLIDSELKAPKLLISMESHRGGGAVDGRARGRYNDHMPDGRAMGRYSEYRRAQRQSSDRKATAAFSSGYFSIESFLVLLCLTASLVILPLILPPLPPPPLMLLLLPIGILVVLLVLAFMPSDVRNIASSYLPPPTTTPPV